MTGSKIPWGDLPPRGPRPTEREVDEHLLSRWMPLFRALAIGAGAATLAACPRPKDDEPGDTGAERGGTDDGGKDGETGAPPKPATAVP